MAELKVTIELRAHNISHNSHKLGPHRQNPLYGMQQQWAYMYTELVLLMIIWMMIAALLKMCWLWPCASILETMPSAFIFLSSSCLS